MRSADTIQVGRSDHKDAPKSIIRICHLAKKHAFALANRICHLANGMQTALLKFVMSLFNGTFSNLKNMTR
jgi:hypothetical protein